MRKDPETGDSWKLSPLGGLQEPCEGWRRKRGGSRIQALGLGRRGAGSEHPSLCLLSPSDLLPLPLISWRLEAQGQFGELSLLRQKAGQEKAEKGSEGGAHGRPSTALQSAHARRCYA